VLHGTLSSTTPLTESVTVGFVVGDSSTVKKGDAYLRYDLNKSVLEAGSYSISLPVHDNIGYWYRAYVQTPDTVFYGKLRHFGLELVDLGLSVKWANMNVGANIPEDYGNYYAFGETQDKSTYSDVNYTCRKNGRYITLGNGRDIAGSEHDAAHVNMGNVWCMPTESEMRELSDKCTWKWTSQNNVSGYRVTGPSGNSIFLPAGGYRDGSSYNRISNGGVYMTSLQVSDDYSNGFVKTLCFTSSNRAIYSSAEWGHIFGNNNGAAYRFMGHSVRPVAKPNAITGSKVMNILTDSTVWKLDDTKATV
jgi:hypothetical protein